MTLHTIGYGGAPWASFIAALHEANVRVNWRALNLWGKQSALKAALCPLMEPARAAPQETAPGAADRGGLDRVRSRLHSRDAHQLPRAAGRLGCAACPR